MIRKAKIKDFQNILEIFKEVQNLHAENEPSIFRFGAPIDLTIFKEMLNNEKIVFLVSEDDDTINGFLIGGVIEHNSNLKLPRKIFAIENLAVKKDFFKRQIGKKLINKAKELAESEKCDSLDLNVWCFNENAIGFYKHLGFKEKSIKMQLDI